MEDDTMLYTMQAVVQAAQMYGHASTTLLQAQNEVLERIAFLVHAAAYTLAVIWGHYTWSALLKAKNESNII